jgi:hypothetical protein
MNLNVLCHWGAKGLIPSRIRRLCLIQSAQTAQPPIQSNWWRLVARVWYWPHTLISAKFKERVELYLYSHSGSVLQWTLPFFIFWGLFPRVKVARHVSDHSPPSCTTIKNVLYTLHSTKITITQENSFYSQISIPTQLIMKNISFPQSATNKLKLEYEFGTVLWKTKWLASLHQMAVLPNTSQQACWSFGLICWVAQLLIPDIPLTCSNQTPCYSE